MKNRFKKSLVAMVLSGLVTFGTVPVWAADAVQLTLDESINMALTNNQSIKVALSDKEKAEWQVKEAKGNSNLKITAEHIDSRSRAYSLVNG